MSITRPLHDIVKKDRKWEWTEKQEEAFEELKKRFTQEPVLAALDLNKKMKMEVDASSQIMQLGEYYQWREKMESGDQSHFFPSH